MQEPANKNATKEAKDLLNYLNEVAGKEIITGQHTQTVKQEEISYIEGITGKRPKLYGFELLSYSPNINYDDAGEACLTEVYENRNTLDTAMEYARSGKGILTFCFHWFSPLGGRDKSFYSENTDFDPENVLVEGTKERKAFYSDMEVIAGHLKPFYDEKIPVLWRPFHEAEGEWFWWGRKGTGVAGELFKLMYNYFVNEKGLDNLLWVWSSAAAEGYPGDEYVDVVAGDFYFPSSKLTDYREEYENIILKITRNKVAALTEVGYIPDVEMLEKSRIPWAYYMTWSKEFCIGEQYNTVWNLKKMYESSYAITQ